MTQYGNWRYYYDHENRLTDVNLVSGTETRQMHCEYDVFGRRISRSILTGSPVYYVYDGEDIIAEYSSTGTLLRKYIHGPGVNEPVAMVAWGATYYYHYDGLGSVIALTDGSGTAVETYRYDAFGQTRMLNASGQLISTSAVGNRYLFTGREYEADQGIGLYYCRARFYHPTLGRFLQPDPIGYADSMNLYQYCFNNPVNFVDPWGLLTDREWSLVISHPINSFRAWSAQNAAFAATEARFGNGNHHNNAADAYRHAYWNAEMTRRMGSAEMAKRYGDAHEDFSGNPADEKKMDLINNNRGRRAAADPSNKDKTTDQIVKDVLDNGKLVTAPAGNKCQQKGGYSN